MFSNFPPILQKGQVFFLSFFGGRKGIGYFLGAKYSLSSTKKKIEVVPMLFTQGINEQQTVANFRGECTLQEEINKENLLILGKICWK